MIEPPIVRIPAPTVAPAPPKPGFPLIATIAPLAMSGVLFAITGSPFMLVMAVLSPVIAVATMADARRQRRRQQRDEATRFASAVEAVGERVAEAHRAERDRRRAFTSHDPQWSTPEPPVIAVGRGEVSSGVELSGSDVSPGDPAATRAGPMDASLAALARLRVEAASLDKAPVLCDPRSGIRIDGPPVLGAAVARELALRLAARLSPATATVTAPPSEQWARKLPHAVREGPEGSFRFDTGEHEITILWGDDGLDGAHRVSALTADATTRAAAHREAEALASAAQGLGLRSAEAALPALVPLRSLIDGPRAGLAAPVGVDADGPVLLDLAADGPHALVAGTTGSGKSELLVSWVLGMATDRSPSEVTFVLVDFKGGAAFAPLAGLPHVLGTLSDLDERLARRAIESLRAEVRRRERILAAEGARAIDDLPSGSLARLVVVVDEFAALVTERPELHALFADLSARGRSLGIHLILCTQRPAGVVRDAVLANVALRLVLRVSDRSDSLGLIGDDSAARLPSSPRGRGVLLDGSGRRRVLQVALADPADVQRAAALVRSEPGSDAAPRPWCDPLPPVVPFSRLPEGEGIRFGLRDIPAEQRQPVAALEPRHGHVVVLGTSGSGKTTALEAIAAGAGSAASWLPNDPVELWSALVALDEIPVGAVLLLDDLDATLARCDSDHAPELAELVARLLREAPRRGARVVVSSQRLAGPLLGLAAHFGARLLLRLSSRDEYVLAGGDGAIFDPQAPPGAGTWEGSAVQVALPEAAPRRALRGADPIVITVPPGAELAVVSGRPRDLAELWNPDEVQVRHVHEPGETPGGDLPRIHPGRTVLLGDPDAWQADWASLSRARRDLRMVLHACGVADFRALTRSREMPPPLGEGEVWVFEQGRVARGILKPRPDAGAQDHGIRTKQAASQRIA